MMIQIFLNHPRPRQFHNRQILGVFFAQDYYNNEKQCYKPFFLGLPENIIDDQSQGVVYETTALEDHEQQVETTLDGASKIISITKKEPTEDQDPNESIKFAVKTRGSANEAPVEFEVELKDQKLIASGQLEDQTQTVIYSLNFSTFSLF